MNAIWRVSRGWATGLVWLAAAIESPAVSAEPPPTLDAGSASTAAAPSAAQIELFETSIRPLLHEHCLACHGPDKQEAGLRLDSRAALLRGSDSGPVAVAGDAEHSRLVAAVRYEGTLQMPPEERLADAQVAAIVQWVQAGLPWPDELDAAGDLEPGFEHKLAQLRSTHWAFQPIQNVPPPAVERRGWAKDPLDHFILARLESQGLSPSAPADRRVWLRRVTYDLIGLPPTVEETDAFLADNSPDARETVVERLLASPRYGERWGRHWLDVARYADSKGYKFFGSDEFFAYTYRDWVIQALNQDLPFDQFVLQQLAADCLLTPDDTRPLAALGFLTVGRRFLEDAHDIIDDRIDVVTRGLLGLTVTCARCHDHKYDAIATADYYALYGVFNGSVERTRTLYSAATQTPEEKNYEKELQAREGALQEHLARRHRELLASFRASVADYLLAGRQAQALPPTDKFMFVEEPGKLSQLVIGRWRAYLDRSQQEHDPVFAPWHAFAALPPDQFSGLSAAVAQRFSAPSSAGSAVNPRVAALFAAAPPVDLSDVAHRYGELLASVEAQWQATLQAAVSAGAPRPKRFEDAELEELRLVMYGPSAPPDVPQTEVEFLVGRPGQAEIAELRKKITEFTAAATLKPPRAMALEESPALCDYEPHIFVRGKPSNLGAKIPRRFLRVLSADPPPAFEQGSGRLELARAIVSPRNPLTARVLVNRVWGWHVGRGFVDTPSDFGVRSDLPTHPELLDHLAARFVNEGWSMKALHRWIVLSSAYGQSSEVSPQALAVDPENRLLSRMNRRRLEFEPMRDALLAVSGQLDPSAGGVPSGVLGVQRTVYTFVDRQNLPGLLRTFDFANPDAHSPQRYSTTVPQQALFFMNSSFVTDRAAALAERRDLAGLEPAERINRLHQLLFNRLPSEEEVSLGQRFLAESPADVNPWRRYCQALLLTNEFVFID